MDNHTQFAVTDGPGGIHWVKVPSNPRVARELKDRHGGQFWCAKRAGGCGGRLALHAGQVRAVHFAHHPGEGADCRFRWDLEAEERSYLHLALQLTLQSWLKEQGIESTLEATLERGGRADLLVTAVEPNNDAAQTIEVQLSPIGTEQWSARTALYLRSTQAVSWIFGLQVPRPVLHEVRGRHGYTLRVRLAEGVSNEEVTLYRPESIEVGTETARDSTEWATLAECHLGTNGIVTPFTQAAIDKHLAKPEPQPVAPILARPPRPSSGPAQPRAWDPPKPTTVEPKDPVGRLRPVRRATSPMVRPRGWGRAPLTSFDYFGIDPSAARADWPDLPEELQYPTAVMAYIVTRVDAGGPAWSLSFPDFDDGGRIQQALVDAGLVEVYEGMRLVIRWQRPSTGMPR